MSRAGEQLVERWSEAARHRLSSEQEAGWVAELRERAVADLVEQGLPHRKLEAWRHTSLAPLERIDWAAPDAAPPSGGPPELPVLLLGAEDADRFVWVDGRHDAALSTGASEACRSIAEARRGGPDESLLREVLGRLTDTKTDAFAALGTALLDDGPLIEIPEDTRRERPLHVVLATAAGSRLVCPRLAVVARAGSEAVLVVEHVTAGAGPHLTDLVAEIVVEDGARLDVVLLQRESDESILISRLGTRQGRDARLGVHTLTLGGRLVRNGFDAGLAETGAEVAMRGLFVGTGDRHVDNHTLADHAMPHCTSRELYKGVLGGSSHGVFCGRVVVRPGAQKTDSSQSNPNLLLTPKAEIDTQPQLEIYADDVKCSHGSTIGRLDEDALFYLRSRGIGADESRVMLMRGFANEIVDTLPEAAVRERAGVLVDAALESAIGGLAGGAR